jgi:hypothetical protein
LIDYYKARGQASFNERNAIRPSKGEPRFPPIKLYLLTTEEKDKWLSSKFDREIVDVIRRNRLNKQIRELQRQIDRLKSDTILTEPST